ncbi:MAG: hypothetical protein JXB49_00350 [Bacteroidales bacterium]|nr:hypothetical protein [Bacteroidales bacterium]
MKILYYVIVSLLIAVSLSGQAPNSLKYQAIVRDASGEIISTQVGMRISILQGSSTGTPVCVEEFTPTPNEFGLVTIEIGSVNTLDFGAIDWSTGTYFVKVELDPDGGTAYDEMGTSQLLSVPYALYANKANTATENDPVFGASPAETIESSDITDWSTAYGWGDHSTAGYLTSYSETDPQVGSNTENYLSKWDGSALVTSTVSNDGNLALNNPATLGPDVETEIALKTGSYYTGLIKTIGEGSAYARLGLYTWASPDKNSLEERLSILDNGNVGIGTINPGSELEVAGTVDADEFTINGTPLESTWSKNGDNTYYDAGYVGIGTNNPARRLHVYEPTGDAIVQITGSTAGFLRLDDETGGADNRMFDIISDNGNLRIRALLDDTNIKAERLTITGDGNVGIGTDNPGATLEVRGDSRLISAVFIDASGQPLPDAWIGSINLDSKPWLHVGGITDGTDMNRRISYQADIHSFTGKIGIGTYTPWADLEVVGSFKSHGVIMAGDYGAAAGNINTNSIEIGGPAPDATNNEATIHLHDHGTIAHQLRYTNGTLFLEADGSGYGTDGTPNLNVGGTVAATSYTGDGSALTGIASGTGGVLNTGSTTIGADTDANGSGEIALQTANTTRLTVSNNGNIGIGTITPVSRLDINGAINSLDYRIDNKIILRVSNLNFNTMLGTEAGINLGYYSGKNTAIGYNAIYTSTESYDNTSIGWRTLYSNLNGSRNTAIGSEALHSNTSGSDNTAVGSDALGVNNTGYFNTAIGNLAMEFKTTGANNIAVGYGAMQGNNGDWNIGLGRWALNSNHGTYNIGMGISALSSNSTGSYNIAIGASLGNSTTGSNNIGLGYHALGSAQTGSDNVAIGFESMYNNKSTVGANTSIGFQAGRGGAISNFQNCVLVGYKAGYSLSGLAGYGDNNILIGYQAGADIRAGTSNIIIGYDISTPDPSTSNHLNIGDAIFGDLSTGKIGIGTDEPEQILSVAGTVESTTGGFKFPDGTVQTTSASGGGGAHYLGEDYLDGIIFYIYTGSDGQQHGLIVSKTEAAAQWQSTASTTNATRSWDGVYNMGLMTNSPAKTWVTGLGVDWYLPSIDELSILWHNRFHVNKALNEAGATLLSNSAIYWSSTEDITSFAYYLATDHGSVSSIGKEGTFSVRAIRAF